MARRRAEINAEVLRRKREIARKDTKIEKPRKTEKIEKTGITGKNSDDKIKNSAKPIADVRIRKPAVNSNPAKEQPAIQNAGREQHQPQVTGKIKMANIDKYPAKTELTDEELKHPMMHEPEASGSGVPGKPLIKLKQIKWSNKPATHAQSEVSAQ